MIKRNKNKIDISKKRILNIRLNKKTGKKIARTALVLTLGLTMALSNPLNFLGKSKVAVRLQKAAQKAVNTKVASAGTNEDDLLKDVKYVSDIKITAGDSRSECIKKLQNAGYKAFDQDLNEHCGGNYIYMGYKTSDNREEAITDIRQLHMGVGSDSEKPYGYIDYKTVLSDKRDQFNEASSSLLIALKEYSDNLDAGNKFAKQANKLLNLYTVDDADDEPLGDYLAREDLTVDKLSKILLESNGDVPTTIYTSIFRGIQSDKEDEMWAKLAVKSGSKDYICSTNNTDAFNKSLKLYDGKYLLMAEDLAPKIKEFAKSYNDAVQRIESNNGEINEKDENAATDASIISSKTVLDQFEFPENTFSANADIPTKLGDYIVYVGSNKDSSITLSKTAGYRMLYPLVEAFTQGQIEMLKINSLSSAVGNMLDTEEADQEFEKNYNKALSVLKNDLNVTTISIYANVDNSYLNGKVAVTSAARRQDAAGKTFLKAKERVAKKEKLINDVTTGLRLTMEIVGIASGVVYIASAITAKVVASSAAAAYAAAHGVAATAAAAATAGAEAVAASTACCWLGVATTVFFWVGIALLVALILWSLLSGWIADKAYDPKIERTETLDNIYDMQKIDDESHYIYYEGIKGDDGKTADINDGSGERWSSLFYTKDTRVGSPLCVSDDGDVFSARTNSDVCLFSSPLRHFENKAAENIKQYSKKPKYKMYLHYHTLASLGQEENKGSTSNEKGEYLYDIMEISADSDDDCKNQLLSKGFDYIDENLTPADTKHTFVGFKTTNNAKNAIRDIRVGSNTQATKLFYGSAGYSGSGATNNENTIYWTKSEDAGTPILAKNFTFSEKVKAKDSGWEPVCQLGGGAPFNFNARRDETALSEGRLGVGGALYTNGKTIYLYFKPETTFTSGTEYIAGFATVNGYPYEGVSVTERLKRLGYTPLDVNLAPDNCYNYVKEDPMSCYKKTQKKKSNPTRYEAKMGLDKYTEYSYHCYRKGTYSSAIGYYTTYNPYRAIRDIKIKRGTPKQLSLDITMSSGGYSYAACPAYVSMDFPTINILTFNSRNEIGKYENENNVIDIGENTTCVKEITVARSNAYLTPSMFDYGHEETSRDYRISYVKHSTPNEDKDFCKFDMSILRAQNLYVTIGTDDFGEPIKVSDIALSKGKPFAASSGYENVREFTDQYNMDGHSISLPYPSADNAKKEAAKVFLGVKKDNIEEKPYISEISANYYEVPAKNAEGKDLSNEEKNEYNKIVDDQAIQQAIGTGCGELVMRNTAVNVGDAWYDKRGTYNGKSCTTANYTPKASYMAVKRTSDEDEAITGVLRYIVKNGERPGTTLKIGNIKYKRGGEALKTIDGDCYVYYTNSKFVNSGRPITDISIDNTPYVDDTFNVPSIDENNKTYYDMSTKFIFNYKSKYLPDGVIHKIYVAEADTADEAKLELSRKGANRIIDVDFNRGTDGKCIYVGFSTLSKEVAIEYIEDIDGRTEEELEEDWFSDPDMDPDEEAELREYIDNYRVVYDVKCRSYYKSETPLPSFKQDGKTYKLASNSSLNEGCSGKATKDIYIYVTNDYIDLVNTDAGEDSRDPEGIVDSALHDISVCSGDIVPVEKLLWENVVNYDGSHVDVNGSIMGCSTVSKAENMENVTKKNFSDIRLYLFARRLNSGIKPENAINTQGWSQTIFPAFDFYMIEDKGTPIAKPTAD